MSTGHGRGRAASRLALAALCLAAPAHAVPLRVEAQVGGQIPLGDAPYGAEGADFLDRFGPVERNGPETELVLGLAVLARVSEMAELGVAATRLAGSYHYAASNVPDIHQSQSVTAYPVLAVAGVSGGPESVALRATLGVGAAFASVQRRGYLDDGDASGASLAAGLTLGAAYRLPAGLEIGAQLAGYVTSLPSTHPDMPIEDDRTLRCMALNLTLGWSAGR